MVCLRCDLLHVSSDKVMIFSPPMRQNHDLFFTTILSIIYPSWRGWVPFARYIKLYYICVEMSFTALSMNLMNFVNADQMHQLFWIAHLVRCAYWVFFSDSQVTFTVCLDGFMFDSESP